MLSPQVKELITKARIVSVDHWQGAYPDLMIERFQQADDDGRYLSDEDIQAIQSLVPDLKADLLITQQLRDHAADIVDEARAEVLRQFPGIVEPGGGLYPALRAEACWRDFWHFLRCITYGIAARRTDFTSATGLHYMEQLYEALHVPLEAMVFGLNALRDASLKRSAVADALRPYFDHLTDALAAFQK